MDNPGATAQIRPDRLARFLSPDVHLRHGQGAGANGKIDVCAMQAVAWLAGEPNTDQPDCACPVIGRFVIRLNDSRLFRDHRDRLKPYCPRLVGTRSTRDVERRRAYIAADYAVRKFAPTWLRALKREEWAAELEGVEPVVDRPSAVAARDAARKVRAYAAAYAAAAAYADADADAAADAAAAADADADADAAADAAADAYADADALRVEALECLDAMIAVA